MDMLIGLVGPGDAPGSGTDAVRTWLPGCGFDAEASELPGLADVRGEANELTLLRVPAQTPGRSPARLCLLGLGKFDPDDDPDEPLCRLRAALGAALVKARDLRLRRVALAVDSLNVPALAAHPMAKLVREAVYGAYAGLYRYTALKTGGDLPADPESLRLIAPDQEPEAARRVPDGGRCPPIPPESALEAAATRAALEAEAVALARDLVNTPANLLTPSTFADKARALCAGLPVTVSVLDEKALRAAGLNALLAVGQGGAAGPAMVCLDYAPAGREQDNPLVLVGKGLCFDSGGISLKPALDMHEMKGDMAGAAAVLAAIVLIARLGAARPDNNPGGGQRVVGLLPCAENMPDGAAVRPGDVIRTLSGKTVEIVNTDAEGRLVLCDALTYAQQTWKPTRLVDAATLTGACVVALGPKVAGLFATDDALAGELIRLGKNRGERFWRLPLWPMYAENLASPTADCANSGPREGGAATAAVFLRQFVAPGTAWAHLDIAGPAYARKKTPEHVTGGTGFAVRTLAALACGEQE
jgi:leucyl aminopeptidase